MQRQDARNGRIKDYRIEVSDDGTTWTRVAEGSFTEALTPQNVEFDARGGCAACSRERGADRTAPRRTSDRELGTGALRGRAASAVPSVAPAGGSGRPAARWRGRRDRHPGAGRVSRRAGPGRRRWPRRGSPRCRQGAAGPPGGATPATSGW
ncbi:discoidin domain-containing protein [Streptomyces coelicoflavus]|uniref:discoidin domain-containing protein n=1 Tax=Streptomyces coelicoflavus TaxID=285562 RepID=UPI00363082B2